MHTTSKIKNRNQSKPAPFPASEGGLSMLIPLRHENMQGRRWPIITFGIIALNIVVFLGTHWTMDREAPELGETKVHILLLAAAHPDLKIQGKAQDFLTAVQTH